MSLTERHDRALLDALDQAGGTFSGLVWRVTSNGRPALKGSTSKGRWSGGEDYSVLYTSCEEKGALAEVGFRLSQEPVWPSKLTHQIHKLSVECNNVLDLSDYGFLTSLGVYTEKYQSLDYSVTSKISAAANFLGFDALIVPSARFPCKNLVIYNERDNKVELLNSNPINWEAWRDSQ